MVLDFDPQTGLVQIGYFKFLLENLFSYVGVLLGFLFHLYQQSKIAESQAKSAGLKEEEVQQFKKDVRRQFIITKSEDYFEKVEKLAAETPGDFDDKLVFYLRKFVSAYKITFGDEPSIEEIQQMKDRADALSHQDHVRRGTCNNQEVKDEPVHPA